jgi:hypothetical protein
LYVTDMQHSPTGATGTGWERTPWHATQRAAWEAPDSVQSDKFPVAEVPAMGQYRTARSKRSSQRIRSSSREIVSPTSDTANDLGLQLLKNAPCSSSTVGGTRSPNARRMPQNTLGGAGSTFTFTIPVRHGE